MDDRRGADAEDGWLTVGEAALCLGLTPGGVRALERRGHLVADRTLGGWRLFRLRDVERLRRLRARRKNRYAPISRDGAGEGTQRKRRERPASARGASMTREEPDRQRVPEAAPSREAARLQPSPAVRGLALRVLQHEAGGRRAPEALADAAEHVCLTLCLRLARLVGGAGCMALLERALHLAKAECPALGGVRAAAEPAGRFEGLRDSVRVVPPAQAREALAALPAHCIGLLATFIGEDLALRLVDGIWPEVSLTGAHRAAEEAGR